MAKYNLTKKAVQDLKQIWNYSFDKWSEKQADKYYKELLKQCSKIAGAPESGKQYENLHPGLRGFKVNRHIIFFKRIAQKEIEVERILHERMDLSMRLSDE